MEKKFVKVSECNSGDMLGRDIYDDNGIKLLCENTVINDYIKNKLKSLGIHSLWILREETVKAYVDSVFEGFRDDYNDNVTKVKKMLEDLSEGKSIRYGDIETINDVIYEDLNDNNYIVKCLNEIHNYDMYTYNHSVNVALYSMLIAKWNGFSVNEIKEAITAGLLHDIGKVKIPDNILNKKGKLEEAEFEEIKKHTLYGYSLVKNSKEISEDVKRAILMHHERIDGSGYPRALSGAEIGKYSKIVAIADVFDAITSERVYKKKATPFEAFQFFMDKGIESFDITMLKNFLFNLSAYYIGSNVELSNGENGKIVYIPPQDILSPIVVTQSTYIDFSKENDIRIIALVS
jgi:putative nucleotidyltransferase with HDIG domain